MATVIVNLYRWRQDDMLQFRDAIDDHDLSHKRIGMMRYKIEGEEATLREFLQDWFDDEDVEEMLNPKNESLIQKTLKILAS